MTFQDCHFDNLCEGHHQSLTSNSAVDKKQCDLYISLRLARQTTSQKLLSQFLGEYVWFKITS